jgi:hypothetical protein
MVALMWQGVVATTFMRKVAVIHLFGTFLFTLVLLLAYQCFIWLLEFGFGFGLTKNRIAVIHQREPCSEQAVLDHYLLQSISYHHLYHRQLHSLMSSLGPLCAVVKQLGQQRLVVEPTILLQH